YVTGESSANFLGNLPTTADAVQPQNAGGLYDAFVAKLASDGSALAYASFLGGSGIDIGQAIALGKDGQIAIAGSTASPDFPVHNAYQSSFIGRACEPFECPGAFSDGFVARMDLVAATNLHLIAFTLDKNRLQPGDTAHGTVMLDQPAPPGGITVALSG